MPASVAASPNSGCRFQLFSYNHMLGRRPHNRGVRCARHWRRRGPVRGAAQAVRPSQLAAPSQSLSVILCPLTLIVERQLDGLILAQIEPIKFRQEVKPIGTEPHRGDNQCVPEALGIAVLAGFDP
jgi:hypothetical protein